MDTQTTTPAKRGPKPRNIDRDVQIQQLRKDGKTLQAIADLFDISRQRVCQIVKG
jgi:DNA-binding CsgD family transcriptional regulator